MHQIMSGTINSLRGLVNSRLSTNSLFLMINSVVMAGLGFVFWALAARIYSAEDVGLSSALISAATLLAFAGSLGLDYAVIRFLPDNNENRSSLINLALTIAVVATTLISLIYVAGIPWWSPNFLFMRNNPIYILAFVTFSVAWVTVSQMNATFIGFRRAEFVLTQNSINSILKLGIVIILGLFVSNYFNIFAAWGLAAFCTLLISTIFLLPRLFPGYRYKANLKKQMTKDMVRFSVSNYLSNGLWSLPQWVLPLIIVNTLGTTKNAYYSIAYLISGILFAVPSATSTSLFAEGSSEIIHLNGNLIRSLKLTLAILVPGIILLVTIGGKILLLFGREYSVEGLRLLWLFALSSLPMSVNYLYLSVARIQKRLKSILLISSSIAVSIFTLSFILMPHLGILGIGFGWLASHSVVALIIIPKLWKIIRTKDFVVSGNG
jgi:O-antigen/teichoic acid export membrane protein